MSINDRMLNERLEEWIKHFKPTQKVSKQENEKVFNYESYGKTIEFAEKLGWIDTHGDAITTTWTSNDADALEEEAIDYINSKGYKIIHESS